MPKHVTISEIATDDVEEMFNEEEETFSSTPTFPSRPTSASMSSQSLQNTNPLGSHTTENSVSTLAGGGTGSVSSTGRRTATGSSISVPAAGGPQRKSKTTKPRTTKVCTGFRGGNIPEHKGHVPRVGHTAVMYQRDFYVFGGVNQKGLYSNHLYCHDKRSLHWEEIRGLGVIPTGRSNHSAIMHGTKMVVYGGHRNLEVFDDLYTFDFARRRWDKIGYEKSQGPGPVFLHSAVYVAPIQSMVVLGGFHHREHNMYIGHIFDIRNRVWSGIPGPANVNPQHLQLVTAAYYEPDSAVIVIGITEEDTMFRDDMPAPAVHIMNVNTLVWKRVETLSSPESPFPFRLDVVWGVFMREYMMMGGFHDELQQVWYFPLNFDEVNKASSQTKKSPTIKKKSQYGFFKLNLKDLTWSIILTTFPKKLLAQLTVKNREKVSNQAIQSALTHHAAQVEKDEETRAASNTSKHLRTLSTTFNSMNSSGTSMRLGSMRKASSAVGADNQFRTIKLYGVDGAPQFQRKYAFAIYRQTDPVNPNKKKSMEYVIMHGGLLASDDYTMLMFTPIYTRTDAHSLNRVDSPENSEVDYTAAPERSYSWLGNNEDDEFSTRVSSDHTNNNSSVDDGSEAEGLQTDAERAGCILPQIPCCRTANNRHRFAVLYHSNNSVRDQQLLPYPELPVAVMETEKDTQKWSQHHYGDTRRWFSEKLVDALAHDRTMRRARRRLAKRSTASVGGGSTEMSDDSGFSTSSSEDERPHYRGDDRRKSGAATSDLAEQAFGTEANLAGSSIGAADSSTTGMADFFERKGLETFNVEEFVGQGNKDAAGSELGGDVEASSSQLPPGMERLGLHIKRHAELQRLPSSVFNGGAADANLGDLGSATAFVLMRNALEPLRLDPSPEAKRRCAVVRWRFLRALVRTGEAAFLIYRATQESSKMKALRVSSAQGLLLAPELHLIGPTRAYKVPSRPIPYTLPNPPRQATRHAELTKSGMVVYHNMRYVK